ncbi:protein-glutamine gamma-glutamyltransferase E-like isoform X2 [Rhinatrema bivittatum]|uniref:protein-glutamine gamma-glutamyltransferase E-like isoform X2 n=1 Tax=Rhinatrema bivittatum TaxID=194408 RepID=UPI00112BBA29|nr:protein-glutamine gamma-glutamyltransferase E-like isoform X2 [Rhinatrema bivittatum]
MRCKDDSVYMEQENYRKEYVLKPNGIYFTGSASYLSAKGWDYGQFEEDILDTCLTLLDQSPEYTKDKVKDCSNRYDPSYVAKVICSMGSINEGSPPTSDKRLMMGRWDRKYADGTPPNSWNSSTKILKKWKSEGYQPVKYGQCWVFAAVQCTVCRCLGIPTRLITNYNSGVDTTLDLVVTEYQPATLSPMPIPPAGKDLDEVWDFHVWTESWYRRTDLSSDKKYDGWQVLDPSRQKKIKVPGEQPCGPASVRAIKEGDVDKFYDTAFVYAEIGSDYIEYIYWSPTKIKKSKQDSGHIGKFISTKAVDKDDVEDKNNREDVTESYKYPDGSPKNREIYKKACEILHIPTTAVFAEVYAAAPAPKPEISGRFQVPESIEIGQDVNLTLILKNLTSGAKTVKVEMNAYSILYTRKPIQEILKESKSVVLAAGKEQQIPFKVSYQQYESTLTEENMIQVIASCEDTTTNENLLLDQDIVLKNPTLRITVVERAVMRKPFNVEIEFQNNLASAVNNCSLVAEGSGLIKEEIKKTVSAVKPKERIKIPLQITPYRAGSHMLLLNFNCNKLQSVKGFKTINVLSA